jgi:3-oxoacyl-[acyl-carrier protein] reductase
VLSARREGLLSALADEIAQAGGRAISIAADITDPSSISEAIRKIETQTGRLDIVVPCAGNEMLLPFELCSANKWHQLLNTHVVGAFETVRAALPFLKASGARAQGQGRVIFISSIAALSGNAGNLCYAACKAAVLGGMRCLAIELSPFNVRVNAVTAGLVKTPMQERMFARLPQVRQRDLIEGQPLGLGHPDDVAAAITFLASNECRWTTGSNFVVDGGASSASSSYRRG